MYSQFMMHGQKNITLIIIIIVIIIIISLQRFISRFLFDARTVHVRSVVKEVAVG